MADMWILRENGQIVSALPRPFHGYPEEKIDDQNPEFLAFMAAQRLETQRERRVQARKEAFLEALFDQANVAKTVEQIRTEVISGLRANER